MPVRSADGGESHSALRWWLDGRVPGQAGHGCGLTRRPGRPRRGLREGLPGTALQHPVRPSGVSECCGFGAREKVNRALRARARSARYASRHIGGSPAFTVDSDWQQATDPPRVRRQADEDGLRHDQGLRGPVGAAQGPDSGYRPPGRHHRRGDERRACLRRRTLRSDRDHRAGAGPSGQRTTMRHPSMRHPPVRLCCKPDVGVGQIRTTTVLSSCFCVGQTVL